MRPPPPLAAQPPVSRPPVQGATANVETTTITTPEGSVSASGWFSWPKFCLSYLLRLFGILALLCLGTAFALSSYSATSALLSSQWHESPTSFPAVTTPFTPASLNGVCEIGGDDTSSFAAIASSDSVPANHPVRARSRWLVSAPRQLVTHSPRAVQGGRDEGRLLEGLLEDVKEAVGEPLRLIGEPPASVKDVYAKQPVSAPLPVSVCEPVLPSDGLPVCLRVGRGRLGDRPGLAQQHGAQGRA